MDTCFANGYSKCHFKRKGPPSARERALFCVCGLVVALVIPWLSRTRTMQPYPEYPTLLLKGASHKPQPAGHSIEKMSGVEKRRSDSSLPVATGGAFATPPQSGLT